MKEIVQLENTVLREKAVAIPLDEIKSKKIEEIVESMKLTLAKESDGVGLAAPQVGISLRIFIVAPSVFEREDRTGPLVYINPKITRASSEKPTLEEGCLSVRNQFGKIKRSEKVTIVAYDQFGKKFTRGATGLLAEIYQHEVDHLD
ncbi:MAG: peptide deformylase [Patescibacteria group bacterium]